MAGREPFFSLRSIRGLLRLYTVLLVLLPFALLLLPLLVSDAKAFFAHPLSLLAVCAGLAVLIAAPIGHAIAKRIEEPLRLLDDASQRIRAGDFGQTIDAQAIAEAPREIAQAALAFNRMSETVQEHIRTVERTAVTDQLTGLYNRRHLMREGHRLLHIALRGKQPLSCLMLDIDLFKKVNDAHGHLTGDRFLIHVARLVASTIRDSDFLARYGGEEFVILAAHSSREDARFLAERIRKVIQDNPFEEAGIRLSNTVSVGVAECDHEPLFGANQLEDMIEKADKALYRAKRLGRNRVEVWSGAAEDLAGPQ
jgi:diguanylate cyclase (GGDEF)-like protein